MANTEEQEREGVRAALSEFRAALEGWADPDLQVPEDERECFEDMTRRVRRMANICDGYLSGSLVLSPADKAVIVAECEVARDAALAFAERHPETKPLFDPARN